jgi:hypothetical protein
MVGNSPGNSEKLRSVSWVRLPSESGIDLEKWHCEKSKTRKDLRFPIEVGSLP